MGFKIIWLMSILNKNNNIKYSRFRVKVNVTPEPLRKLGIVDVSCKRRPVDEDINRLKDCFRAFV